MAYLEYLDLHEPEEPGQYICTSCKCIFSLFPELMDPENLKWSPLVPSFRICPSSSSKKRCLHFLEKYEYTKPPQKKEEEQKKEDGFQVESVQFLKEGGYPFTVQATVKGYNQFTMEIEYPEESILEQQAFEIISDKNPMGISYKGKEDMEEKPESKITPRLQAMLDKEDEQPQNPPESKITPRLQAMLDKEDEQPQNPPESKITPRLQAMLDKEDEENEEESEEPPAEETGEGVTDLQQKVGRCIREKRQANGVVIKEVFEGSMVKEMDEILSKPSVSEEILQRIKDLSKLGISPVNMKRIVVEDEKVKEKVFYQAYREFLELEKKEEPDPEKEFLVITPFFEGATEKDQVKIEFEKGSYPSEVEKILTGWKKHMENKSRSKNAVDGVYVDKIDETYYVKLGGLWRLGKDPHQMDVEVERIREAFSADMIPPKMGNYSCSLCATVYVKGEVWKKENPAEVVCPAYKESEMTCVYFLLDHEEFLAKGSEEEEIEEIEEIEDDSEEFEEEKVSDILREDIEEIVAENSEEEKDAVFNGIYECKKTKFQFVRFSGVWKLQLNPFVMDFDVERVGISGISDMIPLTPGTYHCTMCKKKFSRNNDRGWKGFSPKLPCEKGRDSDPCALFLDVGDMPLEEKVMLLIKEKNSKWKDGIYRCDVTYYRFVKHDGLWKLGLNPFELEGYYPKRIGDSTIEDMEPENYERYRCKMCNLSYHKDPSGWISKCHNDHCKNPCFPFMEADQELSIKEQVKLLGKVKEKYEDGYYNCTKNGWNYVKYAGEWYLGIDPTEMEDVRLEKVRDSKIEDMVPRSDALYQCKSCKSKYTKINGEWKTMDPEYSGCYSLKGEKYVPNGVVCLVHLRMVKGNMEEKDESGFDVYSSNDLPKKTEKKDKRKPDFSPGMYKVSCFQNQNSKVYGYLALYPDNSCSFRIVFGVPRTESWDHFSKFYFCYMVSCKMTIEPFDQIVSG